MTVLAYEGIDKAGLACIGTSHHGKAGDILFGCLLAVLGKTADDEVQKVTGATARSGADAMRVAQTEGIELGSQVHLVVVHLVAHQYHGFLGTAQDACHGLIKVGNTIVSVHEEQDYVGLVRGQLYLLAYLLFEYIIAVHDPSAGVHHGKLVLAPLALAILAVACSACLVTDYGVACLSESVEEGALADIGSSYYRY